VTKEGLTEDQMEKIRNHANCGEEYAESDPWFVDENDSNIILATDMDNFDIREYLREIKVPDKNIEEGPEGFLFMNSFLTEIEEEMKIPSSERLEQLNEILKDFYQFNYDKYLLDQEIKDIKKLHKKKQKEISNSNFEKAIKLKDKVESIEAKAQERILKKLEDVGIYAKFSLSHAIKLIKAEEKKKSDKGSNSFVVVVDPQYQIVWDDIKKSFSKKPHLKVHYKKSKMIAIDYLELIKNHIEALKKGAHLNENLDNVNIDLIVSFPGIYVLSITKVDSNEGSISPIHPKTIQEVVAFLK